MKTTLNKLTPVIVVDKIETCLPFWVERLGFTKVAEVPEGNELGFVILVKDSVEVMLQSRDSVRKDIPALADSMGHSVGLFLEVSDVHAMEQALQGANILFPMRQTAYGTQEIGVREPGGNVVVFAQHA